MAADAGWCRGGRRAMTSSASGSRGTGGGWGWPAGRPGRTPVSRTRRTRFTRTGRGWAITRPHPVWRAEITSVRLAHGVA